MEKGRLTQVVAFSGWIIAITWRRSQCYRCWVVTPELVVLNDGECYAQEFEAFAAGRVLVELSLESGDDGCRQPPDI